MPPDAAAVDLERRVRLSDQPERGGPVRHGARAGGSCLPPCRSPPPWASSSGSLRSAPPAIGSSPSALALVTAGILGNLYDRLGLPGLAWPAGWPEHHGESVHAVRDFILVMIGPLALAHLQPRRQFPGLRRGDAGVARLFRQTGGKTGIRSGQRGTPGRPLLAERQLA